MDKLNLIGQGRTADIFNYGVEKILKLYKPDISRDVINVEYLISQHVYKLGLQSPKPFDIINIEDKTGIIFQKISGISMLKMLSNKPWIVSRESIRLAELHYSIHKLSVSEFPRMQKEILAENINQVAKLTTKEKGKIINHLKDLPEGNKLCHGDFHPDNVLIGDRDWIIDWPTGMSGNPAGDIARTFLLLRLASLPDGTPKIIKYIANRLRKQMYKIYIKQYIKLSGINYSEIDRWILPVAAARLVEGVPEEEKMKLLSLIKEKIKEI